MKIKMRKKKITLKKNVKGGSDTTPGCSNCPANTPTMSELSWNDRYVYGKSCASGWGKGGSKKKMSKRFRLLI